MPPPEPNKKIDDLLKAYSKKRREQAEPGFELHPVSRKALLDEVGRTFAETESKAPTRWKLSEWWRWLAVGGAMVWVLILCLYIQMPTTHPQEQSPPPSSPPVLQSAPMAATKTAKQPSSAIASDTAAHSISPPAAPAPVAAPTQPSIVVASSLTNNGSTYTYKYAVQREMAKAVVPQSGLGEQKKDQSEDNVAVANAPQSAASLDTLKQTAERAGISGAVQSQNHRGQQFVQFDNRAKYRENVLSPPLPKVLTAFELERTGNTVRITDADGSVYEGEVMQPRLARMVAAEDKSNISNGIAKKAELNAAENYSFQVSGLNRNLKQKIVFTGHVGETAVVGGGEAAFVSNVSLGSVQAPGAQAANQNSLQSRRSLQNNNALLNQSSVQNQQPLQNISCEGRVQVGKSSEFQIQATPVP